MEHYPLHTPESAPPESLEVLEAATARYGFAPNLIRVMAESPAMARAYWAIGEIFSERSSLTPAEQQVVLLSVSRTNACRYCMAAHSGAAQAAGVSRQEIAALRDGAPLADARLEALRRFTAELVEHDGWPSDAALEGLLGAGFDRRAVLDVVVGVAYKTLSNYTNHIAHTPLDEPFAPWEWTEARESLAEAGA